MKKPKDGELEGGLFKKSGEETLVKEDPGVYHITYGGGDSRPNSAGIL